MASSVTGENNNMPSSVTVENRNLAGSVTVENNNMPSSVTGENSNLAMSVTEENSNLTWLDSDPHDMVSHSMFTFDCIMLQLAYNVSFSFIVYFSWFAKVC